MTPTTTTNQFVDTLTKAPARIRVILTNALTWLITAQTVATILVTQAEASGMRQVAAWGGIALTGLGAVILFIRQVTPVKPDEHGLLPQTPPTPATF